MPHIVLIGDSIFDNAAYVSGGPDVVSQLRSILPDGWRATLNAVDGAVIADVKRQLTRIPGDATHLVLSVGGNDALSHIGILDRPAQSSGEVLDLLASIREGFGRAYRSMIAEVTAKGLPLVVCTIYNGRMPDPALQRRAETAVVLFDDIIIQNALERKLGLIELRHVCNAPEDYANPIEPSVRGGEKIALAIKKAILGQ